MDLYEELGVPRDASPAEIKKAHRRKVRDNHPDTGGDAAKFQAVQLAYDTLKDDEKRKRYDETGKVDSATNDQAFHMLAGLIGEMLNAMIEGGDDLERVDFRQMALNAVADNKKLGQEDVRKLRKLLTRAEKMALRWKRKEGAEGPNVIGGALSMKIDGYRGVIAKREEALLIWDDVRALLESYDYEHVKGGGRAGSGGFDLEQMLHDEIKRQAQRARTFYGNPGP